MLFVGRRDVEALLPLRDCIDLMEGTLRNLAEGKSAQPLRSVMTTLSGTGQLALMPAQLGEAQTLGVKAVSVFPGNRRIGLEGHQGVVILFDHQTGAVTAIMDAGAITAIRTAAVTAVATRALSDVDAGTLVVLGAGTQAKWSIKAIAQVRRLRSVRIWSRTSASSQSLASLLRDELGHDGIIAVSDPAEAVADADIVVTATTSSTPILHRAWIRGPILVNAIGACVPTARELDGATIRDARFIVDSRESALAESGDLMLAVHDGEVPDAMQLLELGDILTGAVPSHVADATLTVFESLGLGAEDVAAAGYIYEAAVKSGAGARLSL